MVDLAKEMRDRGIDHLFPPEAWPSAAAVSELAHKVKALKTRYSREVAPHHYIDLKKFLPPFCPEHLQVSRYFHGQGLG